MEESRIVTAVDIGTTKVCTIVGRRTDLGELEVLGYSVVPCDGLKKGNVEDMPATQEAVRASVEAAGEAAGGRITSAFVGITGRHVSFQNRTDPVRWAGEQGVITVDDLRQVPEMVAASSKVDGRKVIHAIPISYALDGHPGIRDPLGMHTDRLDVETHVVTGASEYVDRLVNAVESVGVRVESLVLEPIASGEALLTPAERKKGVALVDIGGGTTDIILYMNDRVNFTAIIPIGGFQFTNDICVTYNTPYLAAEEAKLNFAHTEPDTVRPHEEVVLPVEGRSTPLTVSRRDLCQLSRERAQELMRLVRVKIQDSRIEDTSDLGVVLTGGASNLPGLEAVARRVVSSHVRMGSLDGCEGIPDELRGPAFSTGVGILVWATGEFNMVSAHRDADDAVPVVGPSLAGRKAGRKRARFFRPFQRT